MSTASITSSTRAALAAAALLSSALAAHAQNAAPAPVQGIVNLSSSATVEVTKDLLSVVFTTTREGADAGTVQTQLKQALDAALAEARKVARPGQIDVQTGNFSLYPRYSPQGKINGWQGTAELGVEGRDMAGIGTLTGRIGTMTISRVGYNLSRELREKVEGDVATQAIARFRAKAADYAKQFGYAGYTVREVAVNTGESGPTPVMPLLRSKAMASAVVDEALPVEPGKGSVTVQVAGTVQMTP